VEFGVGKKQRKSKKQWLMICQTHAENKGGKCLSEEYVNNKTKMKWECENKHMWHASPAHILAGGWCKKCHYIKRSNTIEICQKYAKSKGGKCLSVEYIGCMANLEWECAEGHRWFATPNNVLRKDGGTWCAICVKNVPLTIDICQEHAKDRGGKCLSDEYVNHHTDLEWECIEGHRWFATPAQSFRRSWWCRECLKDESLTDCQKLAKNKDGKCLSDEYVSGSTKLEWECEEGHQWPATPDHVLNSGSWCPQCRRKPSIKQGLLQKILERVLKVESIKNYHGFDWLKNPETNRCLEIDIWLSKYKLAVEYDGEQHFKPIPWGNATHEEAKLELKATKKRDKLKNKLIKQNKDKVKYFIRIPYTEEITEENVRKILKRNKIPLPKGE
jgi:hypothetical protein